MLELSTKYPPTNVTVQATSTVLLEKDKNLRTVELTNTDASVDVWLSMDPWPAVVNKGFYLKAGSSKVFDVESIPIEGLNAIGNGGTALVAIGRG